MDAAIEPWRSRTDLAASVLVVVPALNEEAHIEACLRSILGNDPAMAGVRIVVADGGSSDRTREIVAAFGDAHPNVILLDNPDRLQSAGINRAVDAAAGPEHRILVRCDAHSQYPSGFVLAVAERLDSLGVASLVVPMDAVGTTPFARAAAWIVDTPLGSGGAAHRGGARPGFVDHGHHAGFALAWFRRLGGYDPSFSHNEDAEYDLRLAGAGGRIWLAADLRIRYAMRPSLGALARQYFRYGRGRARTLVKHDVRPKLRHMLPAGLTLASLACLALAPIWPFLLVLPLGYLAALAVVGVGVAVRRRSLAGLWAGPALAAMHVPWGLGFLRQIVAEMPAGRGRPEPALAEPRPAPQPAGERHASILVCTFRRPQVGATLQSLLDQALPPGIAIDVVVADNDATPSARAAVEAAALRAPCPVAYVHAPAANISIARNACIAAATGSHLAFIDDDEIAAPDWLAALLARMDATGADGVFGPAISVYPETAARWMREQDHHSNIPELRDGEVQTGHTCNALLRWQGTPWEGQRFDIARGVSGGEDTEFFFRIRRLGARFDMALDARVFEPVSPARLSYGWIRRRKFRMGQSYATSAVGPRATAVLLGKAAAKAAYCHLRAGLAWRNEAARAFWLLRGAMHAGVCAGCLGLRGVSIYG